MQQRQQLGKKVSWEDPGTYNNEKQVLIPPGSNQEFYEKFSKILTAVRKETLAFYGHIRRMKPERLVNRILVFQEKRKTIALGLKFIKTQKNEGVLAEEKGTWENKGS